MDALRDMRAKRKSIEVNGVEIFPEESKVCKEVDTRDEKSSSLMMQVGPEGRLIVCVKGVGTRRSDAFPRWASRENPSNKQNAIFG